MIIPRRFNGPPDSGHGGYCAGVFSSILDGRGPIEVTLRLPVPLDVPLTVAGTEIRSPADEVVAEIAAVPPFRALVAPVPYTEAVELSKSFADFAEHPFPTCYGCGHEREDGLRIFPGRLADGRFAAPYAVPAESTRETVWAALDCPGGWTLVGTGQVYLLGRIAVDISRVPDQGDECVVMAQIVRTGGRKALLHTTLYGPGGHVLAQARATWIALARDRHD